MKAIIPHQFILYARNFSLESIIKEISKISMEVFDNQNNLYGSIATQLKYSVTINGCKIIDNTFVVQTWLIDLIYDAVKIGISGLSYISRDEALRLIALHNDYRNMSDGKHINKNNVLYYLYGFFGEQKRYEEFEFIDDYSREEYILEVVSNCAHPKNDVGIDFVSEFVECTGFTPKLYSTILFLIYGYAATKNPIISNDTLDVIFSNPDLNKENVMSIIELYSCSIDELKNSNLKRQLLYTKPFIKVDNEFVCVNPYLTLCLFTNANYWVMRNKYLLERHNKQKFVNAFGKYFEIYVEELLSNCLDRTQFTNIPETENKRADWHLEIGNYDFIIEQKSTLSLLGIKQSEPDIDNLKRYIASTWGEAFEQLYSTEQDLGIDDSIKIILLYEDYFLSESLDLLFELRTDLKEKYDRKYWLVTIKELEMLFYTYKTNPDLFFEIVKTKNEAELSSSKDGRTLTQILNRFGIKKNEYLKNHGILNQFEEIKDIVKNTSSY